MSKPTGETKRSQPSPASPPPPASPFEFIIESVLPAGEVHLFGGPSGSGKTTLLLQMLHAWRAGQPFFGHVCHPCPYIYISCDRSRNSVIRTFKRTGTDPATTPFFSAVSENMGAATIEAIITRSLKQVPNAHILLIDGLGSKVPKGKIVDYDTVAQFLLRLTRLCEVRGLTIIGLVHSPKTKKGEEYMNPRERALGSVAWAAYSETMIIVEPVSADGVARIRRIYLLPRNAPEELFEMEFRDGLLHKRESFDRNQAFTNWLASQPVGTTFRFAQVEKELLGVPERTLRRLLGEAVDAGKLSSSKKGVYVVVEEDVDLLALPTPCAPSPISPAVSQA